MGLQNGYHIERGLLDRLELARLYAAYEEILHNEHAPSRQILYTHQEPESPRPHLSEIAYQWFNLFRRDLQNPIPELYDKVQDLLQGLGLKDYGLFQDSFIQKVKTKTPFHWHQDYPFWPVDRPDGWTVWVAMDQVNHLNGGIEIAEGSNRLGGEPVVDLHTGDRQSAAASPRFRPEDFSLIRPELQPGDALLFHALTYHFSEPNHSEFSRRAWASVWLGPEVRWDKAKAPRHFVCNMVEDGRKVRGFWE